MYDYEPLDVASMVAERRQDLRKEIVARVKAYCVRNRKSFEDVWHNIYYDFVKTTGINILPLHDRLGAVAKMDRLGDLWESVIKKTGSK